MKLAEYKEKYALEKGYESWMALSDKYRENGWFFRYETILNTLAEKYAEDAVHEYKVGQLPPEQRRIFDVLKWGWQNTGQISSQCEKDSGNIGRQLEILEAKDLVCSKLEPVSAKKTVKFWRLKRNPNPDDE